MQSLQCYWRSARKKIRKETGKLLGQIGHWTTVKSTNYNISTDKQVLDISSFIIIVIHVITQYMTKMTKFQYEAGNYTLIVAVVKQSYINYCHLYIFNASSQLWELMPSVRVRMSVVSSFDIMSIFVKFYFLLFTLQQVNFFSVFFVKHSYVMDIVTVCSVLRICMTLNIC